jgi:alpha-galactosidase
MEKAGFFLAPAGRHAMKADRILFLGNSITRHGPAPDIGWTADCGMAASAIEKDYVHLFIAEMTRRAGREPKARILNIADFERHFDTYDIAATLHDEIAFDADIVIVAIGENVPTLATAEEQACFKTRTQDLLAAMKRRAGATLLVRSCFWPEPIRDGILRQACAAAGGIFVDMRDLAADESNYARAEREIAHTGVAAHPGDKGMRVIADALLVACLTPEVILNREWAERVFAEQPDTALPFSFVYGGRPSGEFIAGWPRTVTIERVNPTTLRRTLTLTDPATGLAVQAACLIYTDTPGVDWTITFTNTSGSDTPIIEQVKALDAAVDADATAEVVVHRLNGSTCVVDDWLPFDQPLAAGQRVDFGATHGRSSNVSPFFNVTWGNSGVINAIGWSGQWSAAVERQGDAVRIQAGLQCLRTTLHPGESIRSPRILQLYWTGSDPYRAHNLFRDTMRAHILPRIDGQLVLPPVVHLGTSFYELNEGTEESVLSHLRACDGLGFESFWLDAYWTGPEGFPMSMGNYGFPIERVEPRDKYPHGLAAIGAAVQQAGLGFVMWFEPERVAPGTFLVKEHPEWVLPGDGSNPSGLFNLGIPAARQYMTDYLNAAIQAYGITCLRIDFNIDPLQNWLCGDTARDRAGMTELRYVEGQYRMWDDILRANPRLFIDNCASGGRRIDLETCSRSIPLWRSDNTCDMVGDKPDTIVLAALKNQVMSAGLNRYLPWSTVGQMGAEPYFFRSAFNAGIDFVQDIRPAGYPRELLRQGIAEGLRIRKYWFGDFYPLSPVTVSPGDWLVMQHHRPADHAGIVLAFRRPQSTQRACTCHPADIDATARYRVTCAHTYEPEPPVVMSGSELQNLRLDIDECPGSVLVEYRRL